MNDHSKQPKTGPTGSASPPAPSMPARAPIPRPAPSWRRSTPPRPTRRRARACTRAIDYARSPQPDALAPSSAAWPISRAARAASPSPPAWRRSSTVLELLDSGAHVVAMRRPLRRHLPAVRARAQALGRTAIHLRRSAPTRRQSKRRSGRTRDDLGRDADQSAAEARRSRRRVAALAQAAAASSRAPTTPSPAPMCSGRWSSASTS